MAQTKVDEFKFLSALATAAAVLAQIKLVQEFVPVHAFFLVLAVLAGTLCGLIWRLATQESDSPFQMVPLKPKYSPLHVAAAAGIAVLAQISFVYAGYRVLYPRVSVNPTTNPPQATEPNEDSRAASTLLELYRSLNSHIFEAARNPDGPQLIFVMGAAGSGKSFIRRALQEEHQDLSPLVIRLCDKINASSNLCRDIDSVTYQEVPELRYGAAGEYHFNTMSGIGEFREEAFLAQLRGRRLVIIDDLDELHPASATEILESIAGAFRNQGAERKVVIFGRPEAFHDFYVFPKSGRRPNVSELPIVAPVYDTQHELDLLCTDWGQYATPPRDRRQALESSISLYGYAANRPWVRDSLRNLDLGNFLCRAFLERSDWDDAELKDAIVTHMFNRAEITHGRPKFSYAAYASLFEELAADHAQDRREDGRFSVGTRTLTVIDSGQVRGDVREQDLLSLSGLAFLDPADFAAQSWRFEPIWLHEYFVERFNQRRQPSNWPIALAFAVAVCLSPLITAGLAWRKRRRKFGRLPV